MTILLITSIILGLVLIALVYVFRRDRTRKGNLIPGPKCFPFVGYALSLKPGHVHEQFAELAEQHGDIFQMEIFGKPLIVLNSVEMIRRAFDSDPYQKYMNDRAPTFFGDWIFKDQGIAFTPKSFGTEHGYLRKAFARGMSTHGEGRRDFGESVRLELRNLSARMDSYNGEEFNMMEFLKRSLANSVSIILGGHTLDDDDKDLKMFWDFDISAAFFLKQSVNIILSNFPFLRMLPSYKTPLALIQQNMDLIFKRYFYDMKDSFTSGEIRGFVDFMLNEKAETEKDGGSVVFTDGRIKAMILETVGAGLLTSLSTLSSIFLCLLNYPQYQTKIQDELDRVVGQDELTMSDRQLCPLTEAVSMEAQRLVSVANVSAAHFCESNIAFEGFDIPENSTIIPNVWFVHHDKKVWGDPWSFRPERWLDENGKLLPNDNDLRKNWIPFSVGKRRCIGESPARNIIFLFVATLLRRFTFEFLSDHAVSCDPREGDYDIDLVIRPKPYSCRAIPRK